MSEPHTADLGTRYRYRLEGAQLERERIVELAWDWIGEMRGHDGDCSCRHEATILQQFIEHVDFKGEQK